MFNRSSLQRWPLLATRSTGRFLTEKVGLKVECVLSGVEGGDLKIAPNWRDGWASAAPFGLRK